MAEQTRERIDLPQNYTMLVDREVDRWSRNRRVIIMKGDQRISMRLSVFEAAIKAYLNQSTEEQ